VANQTLAEIDQVLVRLRKLWMDAEDEDGRAKYMDRIDSTLDERNRLTTEPSKVK
jgi:hypothetical protein